MQTSFQTVFRVVKKISAMFKFIFAKKLFDQQVALSKMPRNAAKVYQETDFDSTDGHLLTSPGCLLTWLLHWMLYKLDLRLSRFVWKLYSLSFILSQTWNGCTFHLTTWQVLRTSCWVPLRVLLHSTDRILK